MVIEACGGDLVGDIPGIRNKFALGGSQRSLGGWRVTLNIDLVGRGGLFTPGFLEVTIKDLEEWDEVSDAEIGRLEAVIRKIVADFTVGRSPNEAETEDGLIWPVLKALGWTDSLPQQNLSPKGRSDVPDGLLFADRKSFDAANSHAEEWKRYAHGCVLLEAKRWNRPLDRKSDGEGEAMPPSTQMLRYMLRAEVVTKGRLRWGVLTNGRHWRLYFSGAQSMSEDFLEVDLFAVLEMDDASIRRHWLKLFVLTFRRLSFLPSEVAGRSFHARAIDQGKTYEAKIAKDLSRKVFQNVFPKLAQAIADAAPGEPSLHDVREGTLILLYRLLFLLYAEDRNLLPVGDPHYEQYSLRKMRRSVRHKLEDGRVFSGTMAVLWAHLDSLFECVGKGDAKLGLPPYNGGLFERDRPKILDGLKLPDGVLASVIDALSFEHSDGKRRYINYRDLSVQQLGSVYERILEHDLVRDEDRGGTITIRLNAYARKVSGSFYTPDELVQRILIETVGPILDRCWDAFLDRLEGGDPADLSGPMLDDLIKIDPASRMLDIRICDPAMGSGHFLVSLVDYLSDRVIAAMAEATRAVEGLFDGRYESPLAGRIETIRKKILDNAETHGWSVDPARLDDRHIVRRMVLKRCVYGVDKNPMAVELAKVSLWLHSFTVGAPLSFLDHHLRCGDSLFGSWVAEARQRGGLLLHEPIKTAVTSAERMAEIEILTDAEIAEAHRSTDLFREVTAMIRPLDAFLSLTQAFEWLNRHVTKKVDHLVAFNSFLDTVYGDPVEIAAGKDPASPPSEGNGRLRETFETFRGVLAEARELVAEERFVNWQVVFPGVWKDWEGEGLTGGFDAVIGNPPWDRMKLQKVEWFANRSPEIAREQRAADRNRLIEALDSDDPLTKAFERASWMADTARNMAKDGNDYPLLSGGDLNLYSLFVERAMTLIKPDGMIGLLVPSGIASDKTAACFFRSVAGQGRLKALYDFENHSFFKDVDSRFKFSIFVAGRRKGEFPTTRCAFFVRDMEELDDPERCFDLGTDDFSRINPNTGTAPVFRTGRAAKLITGIYARLPVLLNRSDRRQGRVWPVKYLRMFDMTNDSRLFRGRRELMDGEKAWHVGGNVFDSAEGRWLPLYEGKMVQAYDHRAASVLVNPENIHRPGQPQPASDSQHRDPAWVPEPDHWVLEGEVRKYLELDWCLGYKMITAPTNRRTLIASVIPLGGVGNSMGILLPAGSADIHRTNAPLMIGNLNSIPFDYVLRNKIHGQNINWYIVEQLPVIPLDRFSTMFFGPRTVGDIVREAVLELTYTARDMAPFARDMGYVDETGDVLSPFVWDRGRRLALRAKLDAVFFILYGVVDRESVGYIYSTFPIVEEKEIRAYGSYRSRDLCLAWMNALEAGRPDADIT